MSTENSTGQVASISTTSTTETPSDQSPSVPVSANDIKSSEPSPVNSLLFHNGSKNSLGQPHGYGWARYIDGDCYEGHYRNGQFHGPGTLKQKTGYRYEGRWRKGLRHGRGVQVYPDCTEYTGDWWKDKRQGYGCYRYGNDDRFEGNWYNGVKHGIGVYYFATSDMRLKGAWREGRLCGPVEIMVHTFRYHGIWNDLAGALSSQDDGVFSFDMKYLLSGKMEKINGAQYRWHPKAIERYNFAKMPLEPLPVPIPSHDPLSSDESSDDDIGACVQQPSSRSCSFEVEPTKTTSRPESRASIRSSISRPSLRRPSTKS